jgi:hypothetical protein
MAPDESDLLAKAQRLGINPMLAKLYNMLPNFPQQGAPVDRVAGAAVNPGGAIAEAIVPMIKSILAGLEFQQPAVADPGPPRLHETALQNPGEGIHDWHRISAQNPMGPFVPTLQAIPAKVPTYAGGKTGLPSDTPLTPMQSTGGSGMPAQMYGAEQPQLPPDVTPGDIKRWQGVLSDNTTSIPKTQEPAKPKPAAPKPKPKPKSAAKKQVEELPWLVRGLGEQR